MLHADTSAGPISTPSRKLRVGLLFQTGRAIGRWEQEVLSDLEVTDFVEIVHVFCTPAPRPPLTLNRFEVWRLLVSIYGRIDQLVLAGSSREISSDPGEIRTRLNHCRWTLAGDCDEASGNAEHGSLDVIVCMHATDHAAALSRNAIAGVWWVGPVDEPDELKALNHRLNALAHGHLMVGAVWALKHPAQRAAALEVVSARPVSKVSVQKSVLPLLATQRHLLLSALRRLSLSPAGSELKAAAYVAESLAQPVAATPLPPPHAGRVLGAAARALRRQIAHRLARRSPNDLWSVGIRPRTAAGHHADAAGYRWLEPREGHWWADPFLFERHGRTWLFFEDIADLNAPASIACAELDAQGNVGATMVVLEKSYHLSYPQIFSLDGEIYMLPETGTNGTVELYRAARFPDKWELVRVLRRGAFFDTTLSRHEDRFWFFTSLIEDREGLAPQLLLFSSSSVDGDWVLHPESPISADARHARGAGNLFVADGQMIRPAQDGSTTYGGSVQFRRIEKWNEREFRETSAGVLSPPINSGIAGIHTYNRSDTFEVVDRKVV